MSLYKQCIMWDGIREGRAVTCKDLCYLMKCTYTVLEILRGTVRSNCWNGFISICLLLFIFCPMIVIVLICLILLPSWGASYLTVSYPHEESHWMTTALVAFWQLPFWILCHFFVLTYSWRHLSGAVVLLVVITGMGPLVLILRPVCMTIQELIHYLIWSYTLFFKLA